MSKDDQQRQARELFASLRLPDWQEFGQELRPGGQAGVITVRDLSDRRGVFRCLTQTTSKAVDRFRRELRILTDERFRHPNVVEILDHTKDPTHHWYISRLGDPFKGWWQRQRDRSASDPVALVTSAVGVITQLADGLAGLHEAGVVHRDIKPDNIVLDPADAGRPILIDFGIAHVEYEERLTDADRAVGNKRYSPDVMMNRMDQVPPWLDVFQLSQLLIWMVQVPSATPHWDRPLDWRFVNYDGRLPDELILAIRAVTAICSEERLSPPNGRALASLLRERFPMTGSQEESATEIDVARIRQGIATGKSAQDIALAEDARMIEASAMSVVTVYRSLREGLEGLTAPLNRAGLPVRKSADAHVEEFAAKLIARPAGGTEATLYQLDFGEPPGQQFHFRVQCIAFIPSLVPHMSGPRPPDSSNPVCLYLQRYANLTRVAFPHRTKVLTTERDGTLTLRSEQMVAERDRMDMPKLLAMIKEWFEEPAPWEMIQRDR